MNDVAELALSRPEDETMAGAVQSISDYRPPATQPWQREPTAMDLVQNAIAQGVSIDVIREVKVFAQEMDQWAARKAFDKAMAAAKAEIPTIIKNRTVDFTSQKGRTHYKHEDLAEIARTIDPILGRHGLSYRFRTHSPPNEPVTVTCIVSHKDGYFEENTLSAGRDDSGNKNSIQAIGSTITYLQRYTLKAALGLAASNDDDGKMADEPDGVITDEQFETLRAKIVEVGADLPIFLRTFNIESLRDMPRSRFDVAIRKLNVKRAQNEMDARKADAR